MNDMFVADDIAPRFNIPSAAERAVIELFVQRPSELVVFARKVAAGLADISHDLSSTHRVAKRLFDSLNRTIESELSQSIESFAPWSIASFQPRMLARAIDAVKRLDEFIYQGFGSPPPPMGKREDWNSIQALQRFLYRQFLYEAELRQISETPPSVAFALQWFNLPASPKRVGEKRPTHALIMKGQSGEWEQNLAKIDERDLKDFTECVVEERWDDLKEFGIIIERMRRDRFIEAVENEFLTERFDKRVEFGEHFDRDKFYKSLDIRGDSVVLSTKIENIIFKKIIRTDLEKSHLDPEDDRGPQSSSAAEQLHVSEFVQENLRRIDEFAKANPGKPVSNLVLELFPQLRGSMSAPEAGFAKASSSKQPSGLEGGSRQHNPKTPALWADRVSRSRNQDPIPFLREQYAKELEVGMSIGQLRMLDDLLGRAVERWAKQHALPDDLNLDMRTRKQRNDEELQQLEQARSEGQVPSFSEREEKRLRAAERRRSH